MKKIKIILLLVIGIVIGGVIGIKASELISSSQVLYKDNNTVSTALDELFSSVDINERLGSTDISNIGDGTVTGAISAQNDNFSKLFVKISKSEYIIPSTSTSSAISIESEIPDGYTLISADLLVSGTGYGTVIVIPRGLGNWAVKSTATLTTELAFVMTGYCVPTKFVS